MYHITENKEHQSVANMLTVIVSNSLTFSIYILPAQT